MSEICDDCMEWFVQGGIQTHAEFFAPNAVPKTEQGFCAFCNISQPDCIDRPDFSVRNNTAHWERES